MKRDLWGSKSSGNNSFSEKTPSQGSDVQNAAEHYGNMEESQLMRELKTFRENGQMDDAALEQMARTVSPMLNEEQRARLQSLMRQLRQ